MDRLTLRLFAASRAAALLCLLAACLGLARDAAAGDFSFRLTFDESVRSEPFSGRVYVFFTKGSAEPRHGPAWFNTEPFISLDVENWKPGEVRELSSDDPQVLTYPRDFGSVSLSGFRAQAVARFHPWERTVGTGDGNGYSDVVQLNGAQASADLRIRQLAVESPFVETKWSKLITVRSDLLSRFYGRDTDLRAACCCRRVISTSRIDAIRRCSSFPDLAARITMVAATGRWRSTIGAASNSCGSSWMRPARWDITCLRTPRTTVRSVRP